jgi:VRR-NUC domain-containing protein
VTRRASARPKLLHENRELLPYVIDACRVMKLRVAHFRPVQDVNGRWRTAVAGDGAGFPDLVIVGPGGLLVRELKSSTGVVEDEQRVWLDMLAAAGADVKVWTDADWFSGLIVRELQALRRPRPADDELAVLRAQLAHVTAQRNELLAQVGRLTPPPPVPTS